MSTGTQAQSSSARSAPAAGWIVALFGLWVLATPVFLGPTTGRGRWEFGGNWRYWSNIVTGILIDAIAAYTGYAGSG